MKFGLFAAFAASVGLLAAAPATAATAIVGGNTVVEVTFDLAGAGLTPTLLGDTTATASGFLNFPVTGGDLGAGRIEHENSGVRLSAGGRSIDLTNFIIDISDAANGRILADVSTSTGASAIDAPVFSFDLTGVANPFDLANPSIELFFTMVAAGVLDAVFAGEGMSLGLTGVKFGEAATAPEVPLPAAAWMFLAGAGAIAAQRKLRKAA
ncbi:MAG: VPLPA-CTERM sorting domain-containing protein [Parvularculaceae bacterium]|nr:VPLPA-CTERM sorting domain-containing protein [Parvularculaceae bacterium]